MTNVQGIRTDHDLFQQSWAIFWDIEFFLTVRLYMNFFCQAPTGARISLTSKIRPGESTCSTFFPWLPLHEFFQPFLLCRKFFFSKLHPPTPQNIMVRPYVCTGLCVKTNMQRSIKYVKVRIILFNRDSTVLSPRTTLKIA